MFECPQTHTEIDHHILDYIQTSTKVKDHKYYTSIRKITKNKDHYNADKNTENLFYVTGGNVKW